MKSLLKHHSLLAQDQCTPLSKKFSKAGRRPAWISKKLLVELARESSMECGKRDRPPGRNKGTLPEHEVKQRRRIRPISN